MDDRPRKTGGVGTKMRPRMNAWERTVAAGTRNSRQQPARQRHLADETPRPRNPAPAITVLRGASLPLRGIEARSPIRLLPTDLLAACHLFLHPLPSWAKASTSGGLGQLGAVGLSTKPDRPPVSGSPWRWVAAGSSGGARPQDVPECWLHIAPYLCCSRDRQRPVRRVPSRHPSPRIIFKRLSSDGALAAILRSDSTMIMLAAR